MATFSQARQDFLDPWRNFVNEIFAVLFETAQIEFPWKVWQLSKCVLNIHGSDQTAFAKCFIMLTALSKLVYLTEA